MSLFRMDVCIRVEGSHSRAIADIVEATWRDDNPDAVVTRRHVGVEPLPSNAWACAVGAGPLADEDRSVDQRAAIALAGALVDELLEGDALLFAVPIYNFGVSQHFKSWVDLVLTDPRMSPQSGQVLIGKPAVLVVVRGGAYGPGTPREGWDHATGWMRRILEDVWGLDLKVVDLEFTLVGVSPALDEFKDLARQMRVASESNAKEQGGHLSKTK
jgi:FMN-dependent NADH-azoreductase